MPNVSLTPQLEAFLEAQVRDGRYATLSEAVRAAVLLLERQAQRDALELDALRFRAERARREIERGDCTYLDGPDDVVAFVADILIEVGVEPSE